MRGLTAFSFSSQQRRKKKCRSFSYLHRQVKYWSIHGKITKPLSSFLTANCPEKKEGPKYGNLCPSIFQGLFFLRRKGGEEMISFIAVREDRKKKEVSLPFGIRGLTPQNGPSLSSRSSCSELIMGRRRGGKRAGYPSPQTKPRRGREGLLRASIRRGKGSPLFQAGQGKKGGVDDAEGNTAGTLVRKIQ